MSAKSVGPETKDAVSGVVVSDADSRRSAANRIVDLRNIAGSETTACVRINPKVVLAAWRGDTPICFHPGDFLVHIDEHVRDVHPVQIGAPDVGGGVPQEV